MQKNTIHLLVFALLSVLLTSMSMVGCQDTGNVYLDNGGNERLTVVIDQTRHDLGPAARKLIELPPGTHRISVAGDDGKIRMDTTVSVVNGGLINPAGGTYLVWKEVFAPQSSLSLRKQLLKPTPLKMEGFVYDIEYVVLPKNQLFIEQVWDLGLNESFPKTVRGWDLEADKQYMFKTLLVRKDQLPAIYMEMAQP